MERNINLNNSNVVFLQRTTNVKEMYILVPKSFIFLNMRIYKLNIYTNLFINNNC